MLPIADTPFTLLASDATPFVCCIAIPIVIGISMAVGNALNAKSKRQGRMSPPAPPPPRPSSGGLQVFAERKDVGGGNWATFLALRGDMFVPQAPTTAKVTTAIFDITSGAEKPMPVLCLLEQFATENGFYFAENHTTIPYRSCSVERLGAGVLPDALIVCPRRGNRRLRALIQVHESFGGVIAKFEFDFQFNATVIGYEDAAQHAASARTGVAQIAFAMAAADGQMDEQELKLIETLFKQRFNTSEHKSLRDELRAAFSRAYGDLSSRRKLPGELVREATDALKDDPGMRELAFEFAIRIAAGDGAIADQEERFLQNLARDLAIPDDVRRSMREKFIQLNMYKGVSTDGRMIGGDADARVRQAIGMPMDLRGEGARKWLTDEYRKWNGRVTNPNPKVREEAEHRLRLIADLRTKI